MSDTLTLTGESPDRATPHRMADAGECRLDGADLSYLDQTGWRFERCSLRYARFNGARPEDATLLNGRAAGASFLHASLLDAVIEGRGRLQQRQLPWRDADRRPRLGLQDDRRGLY